HPALDEPRSELRTGSLVAPLLGMTCLRPYPSVLCIASGRKARLAVELAQPVDVIVGYGLDPGRGIDAVDTRGVLAEDLALHVRRQRLVAEALRERVGHLEPPERFHLPLGRPPP